MLPTSSSSPSPARKQQQQQQQQQASCNLLRFFSPKISEPNKPADSHPPSTPLKASDTRKVEQADCSKDDKNVAPIKPVATKRRLDFIVTSRFFDMPDVKSLQPCEVVCLDANTMYGSLTASNHEQTLQLSDKHQALNDPSILVSSVEEEKPTEKKPPPEKKLHLDLDGLSSFSYNSD